MTDFLCLPLREQNAQASLANAGPGDCDYRTLTLWRLETAQETFRRMLKDEIAPGMRALGFKGSGQNYQLPSDLYWALLGFQKSWSDATVIHFTMNLHVVLRSVWEAERAEHSHWMSKRPTATTGGWHFTWWQRIGDLTPTRQDLWWELRAGHGD